MSRSAYIIRRLLLSLIVLIGVTILTFYLTRGIPGIDPITVYVTPETPISQYDEIRERYGLNDPLFKQYFNYMGNLLRGDLGFSRTSGAPTLEVLGKLLPATIELAAAAFLIAVVIGVPLGIYSAVRNRTKRSGLIRAFSLLSVSMPSFWFGLILQLIFFYWFHQQGWFHLPSSGRVAPTFQGEIGTITGLYLLDSLITLNFSHFWHALQHIILPAFTLALFPLGLIIRVTHSSTLEILEEDYIDFARSKGITEKAILIRHVLKNAMIPVFTVMGLVCGRLIGGSVIVENVFSWPGLGSWASKSILTNDMSGIMGFTLCIAIFFVFINLIIDVLYTYLDPRIKY